MNLPTNVLRFEPPSRPLSNDIVTEDSAATEFVERHSNDLRYCHTTGSWFIFRGNHWQQDETGEAFHLARVLARQLSENQDASKRARVSKTSFASGVERFAKSDPLIKVTHEHWDADPWMLGTPGGTVDLRTGELRESRREDAITKLTAVAPNAGDCPTWMNFLDEATGGDKDLIRFLQQFTGYCLTGVTREHKLVFVYGPGGNGKGVFLNTMTRMFGDYARTAPMDTFTASKHDRHPTELAMLRGARLVTASETEAGKPWAEARIKQLTGGDPVSARFMNQDFFTYDPQFKLFVVGNHMPDLHNVDDAAKRRFNIVPFERKPVTPDTELGEKIFREAGAILQWSIQGCLDWQTNGLKQPNSVQVATKAYFLDQDLIGQWIEDCCDVDIGDMRLWDTSANLFDSWTEFCAKAGEQAGSKKAFGADLRSRGCRLEKIDKKTRAVRFIRLRPE